MINKLGHVTLLVNDYDEALDFYTNKLDFVVESDQKMGDTFRWVTIRAKGQPDFGITFVLADTEEKKQRVGSQAANHVFLTLQTDNCERDYEFYKARGVKFFGEPKKMPWGTEVVFEDLYGNRFDLINVTWNG